MTTAQRPPVQDLTDSRDRILQSALVLFTQTGYEGTSLKSIAKRVGMSPPALYWHFKSKDDIYFAAVEKLLDDFLFVMGRVVDHPGDPVAQFKEVVSTHIRFQLERSEEAGLYTQAVGVRQLTADLPEQRRVTIMTKQRVYLNQLRGILIAGRTAEVFSFDDVNTTAFAVITLCEYVRTWFNPTAALTVDDVVLRYVDLAVRMVGGPLPTSRDLPPTRHRITPTDRRRSPEL